MAICDHGFTANRCPHCMGLEAAFERGRRAALEDLDPPMAHQRLVDAVRRNVAPADQSHRFAMLAKECVFRAQDMLPRITDARLQVKLERRLRKLRADLEALDRDVRRAG